MQSRLTKPILLVQDFLLEGDGKGENFRQLSPQRLTKFAKVSQIVVNQTGMNDRKVVEDFPRQFVHGEVVAQDEEKNGGEKTE